MSNLPTRPREATMNQITPISALTVSSIEGESRILDTDLGKRLGFSVPVDIRKLVRRHTVALAQLGRVATVATRPETGGHTATEFYLNRKQAIFITAKSDTQDATDITIEVIEKFDAYERGLIGPPRDPLDALRDPATMRSLLLTYSEKVLALEDMVSVQTPKVEAFDRISGADGMMNLTQAAKALQVAPRKLTEWMSQNRWIYRHVGGKLAAYQDRINSGYLTHKCATIQKEDGTDREVWNIQVTAAGLAKLAVIVPDAKRPGQGSLDLH